MLKKADAVAKLTSAEDAEYAMWERKIDGVLQTFDGSATIEVNHLSRRVRERLMQDYRAAGWTVTYGDDQRDGAWLTFT